MKNSQLAVSERRDYCRVFDRGGEQLVAGEFGAAAAGAPAPGAAPQRHFTLGVMPKAKGDPYFVSCRVGAEEAAKELGADMIWDGPTDLDPAKQNEIVGGVDHARGRFDRGVGGERAGHFVACCARRGRRASR